jgi:hypothetical protein
MLESSCVEPPIATDYDALSHMARALFFEAGSLMVMWALYCDDSGTNGQSEVAVAACLVGKVEQWEMFQKEWAQVAIDEEFKEFHMTKFEGGHAEFHSWRGDDARKKRVLRKLLGIIKTRMRVGFSSSVSKVAYEKIVPQDIRDRFAFGKNHYTFVVRDCLSMLYRWRKTFGYEGQIQYVFDDMSKGKDEIDHTFEVALERGDPALKDFGMFRGGWGFADSVTVRPLQGADILAWETRRHMTDVFLAAPGTEKPTRESFSDLCASPITVHCYNEEKLCKLVESARQAY